MSNEHNGFVLWFTGLSGSGKSELATRVATKLKEMKKNVEILDGDVVRQSLTKDLGFSEADRKTNLERVTFVAQLLSRNGVATLVSFISPYISSRDAARRTTTNFIEVFVKCPVEVCIERDVKGLYKKAITGEIKNFTGISHPYEDPPNPEIIVETYKETPEESVEKILGYIKSSGILN
ncbi:MAG: adenylyl-sulfate kinase [Candidatus Hodarchaeales archaeon]|jgi:adenylylsulfate kinase